MKSLKSLFYIPKYEKLTDKNGMRAFLPSVLGIIICMICLTGTTWAWFSASVQTETQTLVAASFDVSVVSVIDAAEDIEVNMGADGYGLQKDKAYHITLKAGGTASKGYCIIANADSSEKHYTALMKPDDSITFEWTPKAGGVYTFTAAWGEPNKDISNSKSETVEKPLSEQTKPQLSAPSNGDEAVYEVKSGDTLWEIAKQYNTTVDKIAVYNEIENPSKIQIGDMIKIPPSDYELPEKKDGLL